MSHTISKGVADAAIAAVAAKPPRAINLFDIPAAVGCPFASIGIVELTPGEEIQVGRRAGGDPMALAYELAKQSLVQVVDVGSTAPRDVSIADASVEKAFLDAGPKGRQLILMAYSSIHTPGEEAAVDFLKSRRTVV